ncbi:MAG: hypothetical protein ACK4MD_06555 [Demequina sp.]
MADSTDQHDEQVSEGTERLQAVADDIDKEREQTGIRIDVPDDDAEPEQAAKTREDHLEPDDDSPLDHRLEDQK